MILPLTIDNCFLPRSAVVGIRCCRNNFLVADSGDDNFFSSVAFIDFSASIELELGNETLFMSDFDVTSATVLIELTLLRLFVLLLLQLTLRLDKLLFADGVAVAVVGVAGICVSGSDMLLPNVGAALVFDF